MGKFAIDMTDAYEAEVIVTRRIAEDPAPLFNCAICREDIYLRTWQKRDGRSREIGPICLHCQCAYGGNHNQTWAGASRMDGRIARQINAASVYLGCLVARKKQGW